MSVYISGYTPDAGVDVWILSSTLLAAALTPESTRDGMRLLPQHMVCIANAADCVNSARL